MKRVNCHRFYFEVYLKYNDVFFTFCSLSCHAFSSLFSLSRQIFIKIDWNLIKLENDAKTLFAWYQYHFSTCLLCRFSLAINIQRNIVWSPIKTRKEVFRIVRHHRRQWRSLTINWWHVTHVLLTSIDLLPAASRILMSFAPPRGARRGAVIIMLLPPRLAALSHRRKAGVCHFNSVRWTKLISLNAAFIRRKALRC